MWYIWYSICYGRPQDVADIFRDAKQKLYYNASIGTIMKGVLKKGPFFSYRPWSHVKIQYLGSYELPCVHTYFQMVTRSLTFLSQISPTLTENK